MSRFILEADYDMQIKQDIIRLLASPTKWYNSAKLVRAEQTAISQVKNRIGKRYDCDLILAPLLEVAEGIGEQIDSRDQWIVTIVIDIILYHLYSKTGMKDLPEHRAQRYQDAIDWLKDVGNGTTTANIPMLLDASDEQFSEVRIWGREPVNQKF